MTSEFRRMFQDYHARVLRYIEGSVYNKSEAEEIASEVFTVAWQKFDAQNPFELPWLLRTAMYKIRDHQRKQYRKASMVEALTRRAEEIPEPLSRLEVLALRDALAQLSETDAEVVRLTYWDGLTASEVASVLRMRRALCGRD